MDGLLFHAASSRMEDLLFDVACLQQPLNTAFVARVVAMTHAYIATQYATPPWRPLHTDPVFCSMWRFCTQGFADDTITVDMEGVRNQLASRHEVGVAAKLQDFLRENMEVMWQWRNAGLFGPRPAMRCLEYAALDFPEPIIIANYCALMYAGFRDVERRGFHYTGKEKREYLETVLTQLGNAACAIPFPDAAGFAALQLHELEAS